MATIKSFTDLQQSKKLAEILPLESADMYWFRDNVEFPRVYPKDMMKDSASVTCSCWSLSALLAFLPNSAHLEKGNATELYRVTLPVELEASDWYIDPIDACYELIIKLYELKML